MPTDRQFTGQRAEASLGFYDYVARQFDPALGRFLQADTIVPNPANPQSLNRYSYTLGNPLRYTDPSGHQVQPPPGCAVICYTGTTGPYNVVSVNSPVAEPLTVATTASQQDIRLVPPVPLHADDGILLMYTTPTVLQARNEFVAIHGEWSWGVGSFAAEARTVFLDPWIGGSAAQSYPELVISGGPAAKVPLLGGISTGVEATHGTQGPGYAPFLSGRFVGAEITLQPNQAMIGFVPDVGTGWRIGAQGSLGRSQFFVTTRGYLNQIGGVQEFGQQHAPNAQFVGRYDQLGYWSTAKGRWISGLEMLRSRLGPLLWNLPYQEQPQ
jgi:RHS repeat-associated protein